MTVLTPWTPGAPPLNQVERREPWIGWVPSRRQVLAGYCDPDTGRRVDGQVARALRELGAAGTVEDVARRLAIWPGDPEFLGVLFASLRARVEVGEQ